VFTLKKNTKFIALGAILILFAGVLFYSFIKSRKTTPTPQTQVNVESPEEILLIDKSKNFSIVLDTTPSESLQWEVKFDNSYINLVKSTYYPNAETQQNKSSGTQNFEFSVLKTGDTEITFNNVHPWDKNSPLESKIYKVTIQ